MVKVGCHKWDMSCKDFRREGACSFRRTRDTLLSFCSGDPAGNSIQTQAAAWASTQQQFLQMADSLR